jgi:hypothetical protein
MELNGRIFELLSLMLDEQKIMTKELKQANERLGRLEDQQIITNSWLEKIECMVENLEAVVYKS